MDPLSIGSAVVGLIAAASRIAPLLYHFTAHIKDAPKSASYMLDELNSVTAALEQLQIYLMGAERTNVARRTLLSLRNIVATLTACVKTYSDLEIMVFKCLDDQTRQVKRIKWLINEADINELTQRVQGHKSSLTLMLQVLQCESMQEAENSMDKLVSLVEGLMASNVDLRTRIDALAADSTSRLSITQDDYVSQSHPFENDLNGSRVYQRTRPRDTIYSIDSSRRASLALSAFSDLTLGNVSVISVFCLPIWSTDLSNAGHYRFGRSGLTLTLEELRNTYPDIDFPDPDEIVESDPGEQEEAIDLFWTKKFYTGGAKVDDSDQEEEESARKARLDSMIADVDEEMAKVKQDSTLSTTAESDIPITASLEVLNAGPQKRRDRAKSDPVTRVMPTTVPANRDTTYDNAEVFFLAATLFEFSIKSDKKEGGFPYLTYVPGEIFDVFATKGELWLARSEDDPERTVGWLWEKHCARILPDQ